MAKRTVKTITLAKLGKGDLCFYGVDQEKLYDFNHIEQFFTDEAFKIQATDIEEFNIEMQRLCEKCKTLNVFSKKYVYIKSDDVINYLQDYFSDNYGTEISDDFTLKFSDDSLAQLDIFLNRVEKENPVYITKEWKGILDLSDYIPGAIEKIYTQAESKEVPISKSKPTQLEEDLQMALDNVRRAKEEWQRIAKENEEKYNKLVSALGNLVREEEKDATNDEILDMLLGDNK